MFKSLANKLFGKQSPVYPKDSQPVVVVAKRQIAEKVVELELRDPENRDLPAFSAGSHIDLYIKPGLARQYSLANDPLESNRYVCAVLLEPQSRGGSKAIFDRLKTGDRLAVSQPRNHFLLDESAEYSVLIAGGIGITPLLAMAYRLKSLNREFKLYYRSRSRAWAAYAELLTEQFGDRVECLFSDEGGREKFDLNQILAEVPAGTQLYTCGSNSFMDYVTESAKSHLAPEAIHLEHFYPVAQENASANRAFELHCAKSKRTFEVPADKSIVDVLEANGIDVPVSCQEGVCGSCITKFTAGEVEHRDSVLSKSEREIKRLFTPCCSRAAGKTLTIDL